MGVKYCTDRARFAKLLQNAGILAFYTADKPLPYSSSACLSASSSSLRNASTCFTSLASLETNQGRGIAKGEGLRPLPSERFPYYEEAQRQVSRDGHIAVGKTFYSVPPEYLGQRVWVRFNSQMVRVLNHRMESIAIAFLHVESRRVFITPST